MSLTSGALARPLGPDRAHSLLRLGVALAAVAIMAAAVGLLAYLLSPPAPPPPTRNPFGMGVREAAPSATGIGASILAMQASFFRALQVGVAALKESGAGLWPLLGVGFAYGVFHAAGPGHGKAVIAGYLVANERALANGVLLSVAAALVQALVAVGIVAVVAVLMKATAGTMSRVTNAVEITSFAAVAALGIVLTWRKAGKALALWRGPSGSAVASREDACGHIHLPSPETLSGATRWREMAGIALAAGIRPCAGALVVLVFALSQGVFAAGVAATFAMALGTALTTGALASLAVFFKAAALRLAGGRPAGGPAIVAGVELLAAAFVLVLGLSLLVGVWSGAAAS